MPDFLKFAGVIGFIAGIILMVFAFRMDVLVYPQDGIGDPVANLQAMHIQMMWFLLGAFALLDGTLCWIGSAILDQMRAETNRVLRGSEPDPEPEIYA